EDYALCPVSSELFDDGGDMGPLQPADAAPNPGECDRLHAVLFHVLKHAGYGLAHTLVLSVSSRVVLAGQVVDPGERGVLICLPGKNVTQLQAVSQTERAILLIHSFPAAAEQDSNA